MIDGINQLPAPLFLPKGHYCGSFHGFPHLLVCLPVPVRPKIFHLSVAEAQDSDGQEIGRAWGDEAGKLFEATSCQRLATVPWVSWEEW